MDLERFPIRIYFFCLGKKTTTNCPSNGWESQPICRKHQETNLSAVTKSMNKHLEEWRTEMEWRERDPTWGLVSCLSLVSLLWRGLSRRKESASKCAGNELHLITNVSYSIIMSEDRSSPTQHTCNQSQVLWLWKSTVNPTNHSQSKLWITRKTTLSNRILNLELLGHFCLFPMLNYAFRVHSLTFGHYRSLSALHLRKE